MRKSVRSRESVFSMAPQNLEAKVRNICKFLLSDDQASMLSLNEKLASLSPAQKTMYLTFLVAELNERYPQVVDLDLTWNGLNSENLAPLANLKHVGSLELDWNNINGSLPKDREALSELQDRIDNVTYYHGSGVQCK